MNRQKTHQGSDQETEIGRLKQLMPASERMQVKLRRQPPQSRMTDGNFLQPWQFGDRHLVCQQLHRHFEEKFSGIDQYDRKPVGKSLQSSLS